MWPLQNIEKSQSLIFVVVVILHVRQIKSWFETEGFFPDCCTEKVRRDLWPHVSGNKNCLQFSSCESEPNFAIRLLSAIRSHTLRLTGGDAPDDDDLRGERDWDAIILSVETSVDLQHAKTEAGAHSKHGADDGQDINHVTHQSVYTIT